AATDEAAWEQAATDEEPAAADEAAWKQAATDEVASDQAASEPASLDQAAVDGADDATRRRRLIRRTRTSCSSCWPPPWQSLPSPSARPAGRCSSSAIRRSPPR